MKGLVSAGSIECGGCEQNETRARGEDLREEATRNNSEYSAPQQDRTVAPCLEMIFEIMGFIPTIAVLS